jgi:plastocyanin domain-containing protein
MTRLFALGTLLIFAGALIACSHDAADQPATTQPETTPSADSDAETTAQLEDGVQVVRIRVGPTGYEPERIVLQHNVPARLVFTRQGGSVCTEQIQIPAYGIAKTDLPEGQDVSIEFMPDEAGEFAFVCGMDMLGGTLIVRS